jgi:hypothetical protein
MRETGADSQVWRVNRGYSKNFGRAEWTHIAEINKWIIEK